MKKRIYTLIFTIICNLFVFSGGIYAQNNVSENVISKPTKGNELIIGIPKMTDKTLYLFTNSIGQINGISYDTYCPKHNLVLLTYNPDLFTEPKDVIEAIQNTDFNLQMLIKEGTFREVKQMCSEN